MLTTSPSLRNHPEKTFKTMSDNVSYSICECGEIGMKRLLGILIKTQVEISALGNALDDGFALLR
jgi:hypothetical protein